MSAEKIGAQVKVDRQLAELEAADAQALARHFADPWDTTARLARHARRQDPELAALAARALADAMRTRTASLAQLRGAAMTRRPGVPT